MDFIKDLITDVISGAFFTTIGAIIRTCWIVFSSGFTISFIEAFKEVRTPENSYTNKMTGFTLLIFLFLMIIAIQ